MSTIRTKHNNWIQDISVNNTVGVGWCVRIDGTNVFDDLNQYGTKGRKSLQIAAEHPNKESATKAAIEWLEGQLKKLRAQEQP